MTEKEIEELVRKIVYKNHIEDSIKELYLIINKKPLEVKEKPKNIGFKKQKAFGVLVDNNFRDSKGEQIYFPKVGGYYDRALQKRFESKKEKFEYMKENKLVMDGSADSINRQRVVEAGDTRYAKVR